MSIEAINYDYRDSIALITINREARRNALNAAMLDELARLFSALQNDDQARVAILTGAGEQAFSAGADIEELATMTPEQAKDYARAGQSLTELIENLGKPVIAAVNGLAYGGGCELALACTLRVATVSAQFAQPEAALGVTPGFGGTQRLARLIGKARALEMILTGEPMAAETAVRIGLVNRIAPDRAELLRVGTELGRQISRHAPLAIKYALEAVNHGLAVPLAEGLRLESALFSLCFATEDMREGTRAFLEKRPPVFRGK